ncbi:C1GALT1-specific chaperone 1-like isoform X1 [Varroa destructor]|uniref:Uncharacterized protein n=2 Tax=Varroa destructor TaxID=109461 RepID=A0A7M7M850_VARDE|nr:C1GALT1-specific chaperone 1-like isoform X1 [Varroa destructor]XP_022656734.1 C1GALT1-specific chaperone 1-like isoform X1 [Varroa destructor]XP_022656735.1 C1GALT1-specific chaperone 1-like isoform X1 [Varroa destructor]
MFKMVQWLQRELWPCRPGRCYCHWGRRYLIFLTGVLLGSLVAFIFFRLIIGQSNQISVTSNHNLTEEHMYIRWLSEEGVTRISSIQRDLYKAGINVSEAQYLFDRVPITCIVFSSNRRQARAVVGTWGRHCNSLDFVANFEDKFVPTTVKVSEDGHLLCRTIREVFLKRFQGKQNRWVFLASDTTFAVIENLRRMVAPLNSSDIHYLGHAVKKWIPRFGSAAPHRPLTVNVARGGIVLSHGAILQLLYTLGPDCSVEEEAELEDSIAVLFSDDIIRPDTRDYMGRSRFLARPLAKLLRTRKISPYDTFSKDSVYTSPMGSFCCSPMAISLAGVDALEMHLWEFIIARMGVGVPASKDRGLDGAPLRDAFVPPVAIEGDESPILPTEPKEL